MRRVLRQLVEQSLMRLPPSDRRGRTLVLAYHNVLPQRLNRGGDRSLHLDLERFERQLTIIRSEAEAVCLSTIREGDQHSVPRVVVTFDDAYDGAIRFGVPACVAAGVPCTVFVAPRLLGMVPFWDTQATLSQWSPARRLEYLNDARGTGGHISPEDWVDDAFDISHLTIAHADAVREVCQSPLVRIGHHTASHSNLGALSFGEALAEIQQGQSWVRENFGSAAINWLAYPYGAAPVEASQIAAAASLDGAFLVGGGWWRNNDDHEPHLPRWNVPAGVSEAGFQLRLRDRSLRS